jgi:cytoplasmic polyadenylation element-binding protein
LQVRPWRLADAVYYSLPTAAVSLRRTVFIGGVPRPVRAHDLARLMDERFGGVVFASIDTDPDLRYPKGAARVVFDNDASCRQALITRFIEATQPHEVRVRARL